MHGAPTLDALFANLLSRAAAKDGSPSLTADVLPAKPVKPAKTADKKSAAEELSAAALASLVAPATAAASATAASPDGTSGQDDTSGDEMQVAAKTAPATGAKPKPTAVLQNLLASVAQDSEADADADPAPEAAPPPATGKDKPAASTQSSAQAKANAEAPADGQSTPAAPADILALVSGKATHAAPDKLATQAKALPVNLDAGNAKADAKTDTRVAQSANADSAKDSLRTAAAQDDANGKANTGSDKQDHAPQQGQLADAQPKSAAASLPAQQPVVNTTSTDNSVSSSAGAAASVQPANAQNAPAQANAATLQVAPQAHVAAEPNLAALAVSIAAKSKDGEKHFDIRLDPPDLGRVDVRLSVDSTGKAQAHLVADKPQTLHLLQRDRNSLERSLKDAGLDLSNNGLNFSLKGQNQQGTSAPAPTGGSALAVTAVESDEAASASTSKIHGLTSGQTRLDIRV